MAEQAGEGAAVLVTRHAHEQGRGIDSGNGRIDLTAAALRVATLALHAP